jgi:hypothetical protein
MPKQIKSKKDRVYPYKKNQVKKKSFQENKYNKLIKDFIEEEENEDFIEENYDFLRKNKKIINENEKLINEIEFSLQGNHEMHEKIEKIKESHRGSEMVYVESWIQNFKKNIESLEENTKLFELGNIDKKNLAKIDSVILKNEQDFQKQNNVLKEKIKNEILNVKKIREEIQEILDEKERSKKEEESDLSVLIDKMSSLTESSLLKAIEEGPIFRLEEIDNMTYDKIQKI